MTPRDPFVVVQSGLTVTPSPEFAARVRMRVAAAPPARSFASSWKRAWMFGAIAAATVVVVVTVRVTRSRTIETPVAMSAIAGAPASDVTDAGSAAPMSMRVLPTRSAPRVASVVVPSSVAVADGFYEVIVPDDQRVALERLLAAMKAGRASVPRAAIASDVDEDGNPVIVPLPAITPMKIELLPGTPAELIKRETVK
jgi:hypothetical protein